MGINASDLPTAGDYALAESNENKNILKERLYKINELEKRIFILEKKLSLVENK